MWPKQKNTGFTIVELLIVIVVIGILAAITIVAYNGIQNRAKVSATQTAANQAAKKVMQYAVENSDTYPANQAAFDALDISTNSATYQYSVNNTSSPRTYCITVTTNNVSYYLNNSTTTSPTAGGCPGHSQGGVATITNITTNPSFETNTTGWFVSGASIARATDWAASGTGSVKLTNTSTADTGDVRLASSGANTFPLGMQPNRTYSVSATVYIPVALTGDHNRSPRVMFFYSTDSSTFTESFGPKSPTTAGTYTISHSFTIPSNATGVVLGLGGSSSTLNHTVSYDNVMITEGSTQQNYADGTATNWAWNGTPHNSTSTGMPL